MKIYYQGEPGSYSHLASKNIVSHLSVDIEDIIGQVDFDCVWEKISAGDIGVLPIENSYAGSIHANVYHFLSHNHTIIGEYDFEVQHCLLSLEDDISNISEAYSHHQALSQTHQYLRNKNITPKPFGDTAGAAKMISEKQKRGVAAVASTLAAELYNLNILDENIQDQEGNTTKFLIVIKKGNDEISYTPTKNKISFLFESNHIPGGLYNCLEVFSKYSINMTKIESIPLGTGHFTYGFWTTIEGSLNDTNVQEALDDLQAKSQFFKILGAY
ncbi:hypothetical protein GW846_05260 [Candidatus Gracilibacteria bacterium]|nr:hypothetical protein [Candidatus Gracilibacteria bacterium]